MAVHCNAWHWMGNKVFVSLSVCLSVCRPFVHFVYDQMTHGITVLSAFGFNEIRTKFEIDIRQ